MKHTVLAIFIVVFVSLCSSAAHSQPGIQWQISLGGQNSVSIDQTKSGGYIVAGNYWGGYPPDTIRCSSDSSSAWVAKLDGNSSAIWKRCYSGTGVNVVKSIIQTKDNGFIFCGGTDVFVGEGSVFHGGLDAWVVKLDSNGNIEWQNSYGGAKYDIATSIIQTYDGKYVFGGWTNSIDGDVSGNHGTDDEWVVKLNSVGKMEWQKCLGGSNYERGGYLVQTADSGLLITGSTSSIDGNISGNNGSQDMWIVKLRTDTTIAWQKCIGGIGDDGGDAICKLKDGNYAAAGVSQSYFLNNNYHGGDDFYCAMINDSGKVLHQFCYGGNQNDEAATISPTSDGGYLIGGQSNSADGDLAGRTFSNFQDAWVIKCNAAGELEWERSLGGRWDETALSVLQSFDGGYIFAGVTSSSDGEVKSNYHGGSAWNSWIVKLSDNASVSDTKIIDAPTISIVPNPSRETMEVYYQMLSSDKAEIYLYDLLGNCLMQITDDNIFQGMRERKINITGLPEGSFILRIRSGGQIMTKKFSVVR